MAARPFGTQDASRRTAGCASCLGDHRLIAVDAGAVRVVARTAARLSIYGPETGAVLAWNLRQDASAEAAV